MPKVGRVHLPPPSHLTFTGPGYVMCSFCPRPFDFDENAVPVPYAHSNVDSDEVLYYVEGNFMSRRGIEMGSITLHPYGIPHGPQPGLLEKSLGVKETKSSPSRSPDWPRASTIRATRTAGSTSVAV
jgi:homogentisate 1,2-dioxygenase